jgi:hypothetical protein
MRSQACASRCNAPHPRALAKQAFHEVDCQHGGLVTQGERRVEFDDIERAEQAAAA